MTPRANRWFFPALALVAAVSTATAFAQVPPAAVEGSHLAADDTIAAANEYLRRVEAFGFSGSVLVAAGDQVLIDRGLGPDRCSPGFLPDGDSVFYIASLSKAFTAAAVLRLVERDLLELDASLGSLLADVPPEKAEVTVLELLTHRSGLANLRLDDLAAAKTRSQYVRAVLGKPLRFQSGTENQYSNTGYALLGYVLERRTGKTLGDVLRDEVFDVVGMDSTGLQMEASRFRDPVVAHACRAGVPQGAATMDHREQVFWDLGAVGVISTTRDLSRWVRCLETQCLFGEGATAELHLERAGRFGLGWVNDRAFGEERRIWHDGLLLPEGWNGQIRWYPDSELRVIVLSGQHQGEPLAWIVARNLERIFLGGTVAWPPRAPHDSRFVRSSAETLVGRYEVAGEGLLEIAVEGDRLELRVLGQAAVDAVRPSSDGERREFGARNQATQDLFELLLADDYDAVQVRFAAHPGERWQPRVKKTLNWLARTYGAVTSFEVLHTIALAGDDPPLETYVRVRTSSNRTLTFRVLWSDGHFWSLSDEGAFLGETPSAEVLPAPATLVVQRPGYALAWDLATGSTTVLRWDAKGGVDALALEIGSVGKSRTARRLPAR